VVRPIGPPKAGWALLVMPSVGVSTAAAYGAFDRMCQTDSKWGQDGSVVDEPDWSMWVGLDSSSLLPRLANDLEPAAFAVQPLVGELRTSLEMKLNRPVRMSGSGSTLFTLYDTEADAKHAVRKIGAIDARVQAVEIAPQHDAVVRCDTTPSPR
jgi:4-diphosphocytidyl-2C-methyl-D-erythritol kinase